MSKSLRLSEKWFRRGLWVVALVFAGFLTGLGRSVVGDLPQVETVLTREDFLDKQAAQPLRDALARNEQRVQAGQNALEQAQQKLGQAQRTSEREREAFDNWVETRHATQRPDQDAELIARNKRLDALQAEEGKAQAAVDAQNQILLDARQSEEPTQKRLNALEVEAQERLEAEMRRAQLRVFGYRLAVTLPLLLIAGGLFARQRKSMWWPFVWGFIFFALFTFFVELVPYLPSYGGYVRHVVGIVVTVLVGRWAIQALNRYLERQKLAEQQPEQARREELGYDTALARLSKGVCPGCERPVDLKNTEIDFCPHCGIGLFDHCGHCDTRKSAFSKYCHACGNAAHELPAPPPTTPPAAVSMPGAAA